MSDLHSAANELRAIEEMVAREFQKIPPPVPPRSLDELPELDERNPHTNPLMTVAQTAVAIAGLVAGYLT